MIVRQIRPETGQLSLMLMERMDPRPTYEVCGRCGG
jgi:hypothetical protein